MSRFWRYLLGGIVVGMLGVVLALTGERWRGKRVLAATVADLKASGRLPAAEELFAPPVESNGIHRMVAAADRLSPVFDLPSMKVVAPGRAVECFRSTWWVGSNNRSNTWEDLSSWERTHTVDLDDLHEALSMPECRAALDWRQGFRLLLPALAKYKSAARSLASAALLAAHDGNRNAAVTHLAAIQRVEVALAREPLLISQLVRIASAAIALPAAWDMAQQEGWSETDLAALQLALPSTNYSTAFIQSLRGEAVLWEIMTLDPQFAATGGFSAYSASTDDLTLPSVLDEVPEFVSEILERSVMGLRRHVFYPLWQFAWGDQAIAFHLRAMDELVRRSEIAVEARSLRMYSVEDVPGLGSMGWYDQVRFHLTRETLPAFEKAISKVLRLETERSLIETGIALRRFQLRHDRLPSRLDELVPGFLAALPVDGMDGQPLRYRMNPDRTATLWSVGEDFKDDGGDPTPLNPAAQNLRWWNSKDAVLPTRASDAEFAKWEEKEKPRLAKLLPRPKGTNVYRMDPELARRYGLIPAATPAVTNAPAPALPQ